MPVPSPTAEESARPAFSLVVPCYREEDALPALFDEAIPALEKATGGSFEMILVDDGSTDRTYELIVARHRLDPRIKGLRLSRNFGHQPALSCGLAFAQGEIIGIVDADLQDPIGVLLQLYEAVRSGGCDVCYGVRRRRDAPFWLAFFYNLFYRLINRFAEHHWPRDAGDFSVFNRQVLRCLVSLPENLRMIRGLRSWIGFRQQAVPYDRPRRSAGASKYNFFSLARLAASAFIGFSHFPLQVASYLGLGMAGFTLVIGFLFLVNRLFPQVTLFGYHVGANTGTTTIILYLSFISAMLFLCLGVLGEYMAVILTEVKRRPTAIVRETAGLAPGEAPPSYVYHSPPTGS